MTQTSIRDAASVFRRALGRVAAADDELEQLFVNRLRIDAGGLRQLEKCAPAMKIYDSIEMNLVLFVFSAVFAVALAMIVHGVHSTKWWVIFSVLSLPALFASWIYKRKIKAAVKAYCSTAHAVDQFWCAWDRLAQALVATGLDEKGASLKVSDATSILQKKVNRKVEIEHRGTDPNDRALRGVEISYIVDDMVLLGLFDGDRGPLYRKGEEDWLARVAAGEIMADFQI